MTRSILITGCSSGIGLDAARTLKARGWQVFASCRKDSDCEILRGEGFASPRIDYQDGASVEAGLREVLDATGGTLEAVFNNGAFAIPGATEDIPVDGFRSIFEANFFGWHDLTRRILPVMRSQGHGRIVQCSSVLGISAMPWRGAYNATKFALEGYTDTLRMEMRDTSIEVILIEPGPIGTKFRENCIPQFERWVDWKGSARADQYEAHLIPRLYSKSTKPDRFELPASAVTAKLIHAVEAARPRPRYYVTTATYIMGTLKRVLPTRWLDNVVARF